MPQNDYAKRTTEKNLKALSERPPGSVEEFMKQCDQGKSPAILPKKNDNDTKITKQKS